ncbi:MAG: GGDEF domain-containing protein [Sulfurimonas sp.]|uniref:GGDEF domain-containing protein n=1 Tax=Sulfurimonas sp. TaxID=2022749 RepID=UPI0025CE4CA8|nr:GGDEF domain-containing protein [Sulfurimonas sp.]MCK9454200.1 GGDEF domain-containing protein [Sulfurimonas sp.]
MEKNDLKALIEEIYQNLLERVNSQEEATKGQVICYLRDAIEVVSNINDKDIDSIEHAREAFSNSYKELVKQSLSSYKNSNEIFGELSQLNKETINQYSEKHIDLQTLTEKFDEIQSHMTKEVSKANEVISELTSKVKVLEETSNLDPLTKVFNRRALISYLREVCANKDIPYHLHILMIDIDNFKSINDNYGHITGDKILIFISNILRKALRDGDKIFRFGGEEFTIILSRNSDEESESIAKRLLKLISSNNLIYMGQKISITASIGLTKYLKDDTPDSLMARADKALYTSKNNGKNMVSKVYE